MANLSNLNNKFLVTTGGAVLINQTSAVSTHLLTVNGRIGGPTFSDSYLQFTGGNVLLKANDNVKLGYTQEVVVSQAGNLGIGGTPGQNLDVIKTGARLRLIDPVDGANLQLNIGLWDNSNYRFEGDSQRPMFLTSYQGNIYLGISGNTTMTIQSGKVGIGTTGPSRELDIQASSGWAEIALRGAAGAGGSLEFWTTTTKRAEIFADTEDIVFRNTASNAERMRIRASGTVGIGAAGFDSQMLTIAAGTLDGAIYATSTDANCFASFRDGNSSANIEYGAVGNDHVLRKDGTQYFIVNNVGDVYNYQSVNKANTFYGYAAGDYSAAGGSNTFMGYNCANNLSSGAGNVGIGRDVYITTLTGSNNTAVGMSAMQQLTSGGNNVAVGKGAGASLTSGSVNTFVGDSAGNSATTVSSATAVGFTALASLTTGVDNTAIGRAAATNLTTGGYVVAIGNYAADNLGTNGVTIAIGFNALTTATAGDNVAIGYTAGQVITTGTLNTLLGNYAGRNVTTSSYGTYLGRTAGQAHTTGAEPVYIGYDAGQQVTTGNHNTCIGTSAMTYGNGSHNTYVGWQCGFGVNGQSNSNNTAVGKQSLRNIQTGSYNVAMGYYSGYSLTTANYNTLIGNIAGNTLTTGGNNTGVGHEALRFLTTGSTNTVIGLSALENGTTAYENVGVGYRALRNCSTGAGNTALGLGAGLNITSGGSNIAIGYSAMGGNSVTGGGNIALGDAAGYNLQSGANNVLIGKNAGRSTSTTDSLAQVDTGSNQIQIGNKTHTDAKVNISWTIVSDKRDKTKIKKLNKGLDFVQNLKPVSFERRKNRESQETDNKERYGFLAQDVLELEGKNPVIVNNEDKDNLKLTSDYIIPILVNSIKELKAEIELLKSK